MTYTEKSSPSGSSSSSSSSSSSGSSKVSKSSPKQPQLLSFEEGCLGSSGPRNRFHGLCYALTGLTDARLDWQDAEVGKGLQLPITGQL